MSTASEILSGMVLLCVACGSGFAQAPAQVPAAPADRPSQATAQSEAGEPRATTSDSATAASKVPASHATPEPEAGRQAVAKGEKPRSKADRLDLGLATVTGDHEQPKVMYIVPWKRSDIGDLAAKPMNSLVDEILAPVDRDVFKREVVYYEALAADASQNAAPPKPAQQGEK